jgi:hypothetical protein
MWPWRSSSSMWPLHFDKPRYFLPCVTYDICNSTCHKIRCSCATLRVCQWGIKRWRFEGGGKNLLVKFRIRDACYIRRIRAISLMKKGLGTRRISWYRQYLIPVLNYWISRGVLMRWRKTPKTIFAQLIGKIGVHQQYQKPNDSRRLPKVLTKMSMRLRMQHLQHPRKWMIRCKKRR